MLCYMSTKSFHLELLVQIEAKCHEWEKFWVLSNVQIASMIETEKRNYHMSAQSFSTYDCRLSDSNHQQRDGTREGGKRAGERTLEGTGALP
jgi:hypothetical protein